MLRSFQIMILNAPPPHPFDKKLSYIDHEDNNKMPDIIKSYTEHANLFTTHLLMKCLLQKRKIIKTFDN